MIKGILAVVCASIAYGLLPIVSKFALSFGLNSASLVVYRCLFAFLFSFGFCLFKHLPSRITKRQIFSLLLFGICGFGLTAFLLTLSYTVLPAGLASMFHFSYPALVAVCMAVLYREKISGAKWGAILLSLFGLVLMSYSSLQNGISLPGMALALLSGVTYAIYIIAVKRSSLSTLHPLVLTKYVTLLNAVTFFLQATFTHEMQFIPNVKALFSILTVALLCTVIPLALLAYGIRSIGSTNASVLNMLEPLVSLFLGVVIFREHMSTVSWIGCALVLCSVLFLTWTQQRNSHDGNIKRPQIGKTE